MDMDTLPDAPVIPDEPQDLGAAIINEIDRALAQSFPTSASSTLLDLVDALAQARTALRHHTGTLQRIRNTLQTLAESRDDSVTAA